MCVYNIIMYIYIFARAVLTVYKATELCMCEFLVLKLLLNSKLLSHLTNYGLIKEF